MEANLRLPGEEALQRRSGGRPPVEPAGPAAWKLRHGRWRGARTARSSGPWGAPGSSCGAAWPAAQGCGGVQRQRGARPAGPAWPTAKVGRRRAGRAPALWRGPGGGAALRRRGAEAGQHGSSAAAAKRADVAGRHGVCVGGVSV